MDVRPASGRLDAVEGVAVRDVVRTVVANVAAEELPVLDGLIRFDDDTVVRRLQGRRGRREPLGFGWNEVATLVTPLVWLTVDQAARQIGKSAGESATHGAKTVLRKLLRRRPGPVTVPPLTPYQLADIREQVLKAAASHGLRRNRAEDIANAVYTTLSFNPTRQQSTVERSADDGTEA